MPKQGSDGQPDTRYPDEIKHRLVSLLDRRASRFRDRGGRAVTSIALARALKFYRKANRETRRRRIRELVQEMRGEGYPVASYSRGYWMASEVADVAQTVGFLRQQGLGNLATAGRLKRAAHAAGIGGQLRLALRAHAGLTGATVFYRQRLGNATPPPSPPPSPPPPDRGETGRLF
ncbi:MAG: hypothetical protein AAF797_06235 [Planctomycetota bacterium]